MIVKNLNQFLSTASVKIRNRIQRSNSLAYVGALVTIGTVLAVVWLLDNSEQKRFQEQNRADVLNQVSAIRARLEESLNQRLFLERGLVAYVSGINSNINVKEFETLSKIIIARSRGVHRVSLYKKTVVTYLYPLQGNEKAIGFDPMTIPEEREAILRSINSRKTVLAGPVNLVPEGIAFISRTPIFLTPPDGEAESGDWWGMVGIIIDQNTLFQEAGLLDKSPKLKFVIRGKDGLGAEGIVFFGDEQILSQNPITVSVTLPNGSWQLGAIPANGWELSHPTSQWLWIGGSLLAVLSGGLVFILVSAPAELRKAVDKATKALKESEKALKEANANLQELDKLKDEFLANTSHELRTPLNGIIGIAESLIDGATGQLSDLTRSNLATIIASGRRLANLVNDILDFSKLRHRNIELQLKSVEVRSIAQVVLALSQPLIGKKDLQLINLIPANLPPVLADENRLQQILHNLVGNAIKFTESGRVEISAKLTEKGGNSNPNNSEITITVSDTGIGIPEDKCDRIFESFEQADGSTARDYGGTGLGLAVTQQLVELHAGRIWVKSIVGEGSRFSFTLPVCEGEVNRNLPVAVLKELAVATNINNVSVNNLANSSEADKQQKYKVLIVDDEPINLQVLVNHLSLANYAITQATNGQEALTVIESGFKPDLILLDVMMPKMTGYEVTEKIRDRFPATDLPILLLTAKAQVTDLVTGLNVGANDYLVKPISKDELLARIKTHINLRQLREENLRMSAELEITRRLQQMILPRESELTAIAQLEIAGFMEPSSEVGGDYYDVLYQNGWLKIGIGDVTGHGLESGVLMIMVQTAVRTMLENNETDPVKFLNAINKTIYDNVQRMNSDKTLSLSLLDYQDSTLRLSGQHEEVIIVRQGGKLELIDTIDLGFPIGLEPDIADFVSFTELQLQPGDVIVLYTDGITEAEDINGVQYGLERLCEVVRQNWQLSASEIRQIAIEDLRSHIGKQVVYDDITLLVLKQK